VVGAAGPIADAFPHPGEIVAAIGVRAPRRSADASAGSTNRRTGLLSGYAFMLPFMIPFILFNLVPLVFGVIVAFTNWSIIGAPKFVGLANFKQALTDPLVLQSFVTTFKYVAVVVPVVTVLAFLFALYVNQGWPGHTFARMAFYASNVVSAPVIGLVWTWMLNGQYGIINRYLHLQISWLTSATWAWVGICMATVWWDSGLIFILFLAGLQDIGPEIIEAARIDGASWWASLFRIYIPLLRRTIVLAVTLELISTFQIFSQVNVMTAGGPANSTASVMQYLYTYGVTQQQLGYASALGLMLFVLIVVVALIFRRFTPERAW
jgi:multiple sugar transport system permease protein